MTGFYNSSSERACIPKRSGESVDPRRGRISSSLFTFKFVLSRFVLRRKSQRDGKSQILNRSEIYFGGGLV
jgi:hypothetical protein